jgi:transcriptional regulator with XRE-family HTH domain
VDDVRLGRVIRALRRRHGWRQVDLAQRAGVSQQEVSLLERGHLASVPLRIIRAVLAALDASAEVDVRWRGGALDRLLDERHAELVGHTVKSLIAFGWEAQIEVSYSSYGERGSIDVVGWHAGLGLLLVVEVKTELTSIEATLRKHDEKCRLAGRTTEDRFGWRPRAVARLLVAPPDRTTRRRLERADAVMRAAYPARGPAVRAWLQSPALPAPGMLWLTDTTRSSRSRAPVRIRRRRAA